MLKKVTNSKVTKRKAACKKTAKKAKHQSINKELQSNHFRIAIFGSARIKKADPRYKQIQNLTAKLGERGFDIVTGGGPGIMQSANKGHHKGRKKAKQVNKNSHSIGLNITLPFEQQQGKHIDVYKNFDRFSSRLDTFMSLSNVVIVAPGGIGTLLEFFYTWQLVQVKHICDTPIILLGSMYEDLLEWIKQNPLKKKLMSKEDMNNIFCFRRQSEVLKLIDRIHQDHKAGKHACHNFQMYQVK